MALATQCPHCHTTFRVAQDQLKLRAGLVRCGHCKEIFNGIEHLLPPTAKSQTPPVQQAAPALAPASAPTPAPVSAPAAAPTPIPAPTSAVSSAPSEIAPPVPEPAAAESEVVFEEAPAAAPPTDEPVEMPPVQTPEQIPEPPKPAPLRPSAEDKSASQARPDPLTRMTLVDFTHELPDDLEAYTDYPTEQLSQAEAVIPAQSDELDEAIRDLQSKPWRGEKKTKKKKPQQTEPLDEVDKLDDEDEPGFLARGRRKQRLSRRLRIVCGLGSLLLLIAALLQGAYVFRNQLAGSFPQAKPWLAQLCNLAGCRIDLPAQISSVSIESSELQTLAGAKNRFVLTTLLRNYSATAQEWPYIELTLNDANEKPLLRRVFKPEEYLPDRNEALTGFPAASERALKINFELSQTQASGYRVYLFYP